MMHPKYPKRNTWKQGRVINNIKETGWGFIVSAYLALLENALQDFDVKKDEVNITVTDETNKKDMKVVSHR